MAKKLMWFRVKDEDPPKHEHVLVILPDGEECWAQYTGHEWLRPGTSEEIDEPTFWRPLGE